MTQVDINSEGARTGLLAGAPWALVSYRTSAAATRAGVLTADGEVRSLAAVADSSLSELLARWDDGVAGALQQLDVGTLPIVPEAVMTVPLVPSKVVMAGANYRSHILEMGGSVPEGLRPFFFLKPPSTTLVTHGAEVPIDPADSVSIDYEGELGVVIGRRTARVAPEQALGAVAGYIALNDITDRARLSRPQPVLAPPFAFDWMSSKCLDASCPISATVVPAWLVDDPQDVRISVWVNDDLKQDESTADMINTVSRLIAEASNVMTLEPGDILATGTPAGVGAARGERLAPGDTVTVEVSGVGRVTNRIVATQS